MSELVVIDPHLFEKQGQKLVLGADEVIEVPAGEIAATDAGEVVLLGGEPIFEIRLAHRVDTDEDVPDAVGLALRVAADRLCEIAPDGGHDPDGLWVEAYYGPSVHDGSLKLWLDTDGQGYSPEMIQAMGSVFVDELTPCGVHVEVTAGSAAGLEDPPESWKSSAERTP